MQNNFPRIYSLSTIGLKQHFNADYLFHSYRTDFSGESGSGKSMVADMIQLVLAGSGEFKSATDSNKKRNVKGMLSISKGKSSAMGYIFLNVELKPKQYIVIGAYIESTSNVAEMFIIQNGYDWEELTPLESPIYCKDLTIGDKIDTLSNLCNKAENLRIKSFRKKSYHQILYNNGILSLDLSKDETLKTYASILRSFSRGKGFKTESEDLKKFLFGDEEQNSIMEKYKEEIHNINNDFHEHKRYLEEIGLINDKQSLLKNAFDKNKSYKETYSEYLIKRYQYWNTFKVRLGIEQRRLEEELISKDVESKFIDIQLQTLEIKDCEELFDLKRKTLELSEEKNSKEETENEFFNLKQAKLNIEFVEELLNLNGGKIENVVQWFHQQKTDYNNKQGLLAFTKHLSDNDVLVDFEESEWLADFEKESDQFTNNLNDIQSEITKLESLSKFSDLDNPESLSRWAIENLTFPISYTIESILVHFQQYGKTKPADKNANRYIPFPEELFENVESKIKEKTTSGFWLNLDGVFEYIEYSPNQILNVDNPESIKKSLLSLNEGIQQRLIALTKKINSDKKLKDKLFEFGNPKEYIDLYIRKDELIGFHIDPRVTDISEKKFEEYVQTHDKREDILLQYNLAQKKYEELTSQKAVLDSYSKRIQELESDLFENNLSIDIKIIEETILLNKKELSKKTDRLKLLVPDRRTLEEKYSREINNQSKLFNQKLQLDSDIGRLRDDEDRNEKQQTTATDALTLTEQLNQEIFRSTINFEEAIEEFKNPDEGTISLKSKAEQSKIAYEEYLKLITKNLPYDESASIGELAHHLLPTIFPSVIINEELISSDITERLNKLTQNIQEIGSRKIEILGSIFNEVYRVYTGYLTKINEIDTYLKKKNKTITGGNRASLTSKKSIHYPDSWLGSFRKQLNSQFINTGLFSELREELDINKMMIKAFQQLGGNVKVEPEDLMNPKSYFDLEFDLKLENDEINSGSNGQTYAANALLCLARLSLIEEKDKKGLKIMPIDEAEGLGSNYDMLHELAKKEQYQIVTMAIETAGEITDDGQYIYIMNENNLADMDSYVPPLGIFSNVIVEDIAEYISTMPDDEK